MHPPTTEDPIRLFYVDDSGASDIGIISYSWIQFSARDEPSVTGWWHDLRRELDLRYQVPGEVEWHSTHMVRGDGRPSRNEEFNQSRSMRREAMEFVLSMISACEELRVGTVYRHTGKNGREYYTEKMALYGRMISHIDLRLAGTRERAMMTVDGREWDRDRLEQGYRTARPRNFTGPPVLESTERMPLLQAADIVAWTTYQSLRRYPGKELISSWYDTYLRHRDVNGGPQSL
ncbi:hypothetical protein SAMN04489712_110161 [Thermomonospora echinospora]|uniref:DUF3800 domain-containing protein n=1 Tax=Thermomonospora echinospora TaxID=1992 RepID=A0A1H6CMF7_9ACTN|nr:DUF3800 domain-containing protein [Thermomonospora echinospora]SEG73843.1 hypothetical protein SAMN04489712_110161 [Thermomonospora echinospora]